MGQKVNPIGLRLALNKNWSSRWFATNANYGAWLLEDLKIRNFIKKNYNQAGIARIVIERASSNVRITVLAARPGLLFGRKGSDRDRDTMRDEVSKLLGGHEVIVDVVEVASPDTNAQLVAENVAQQLERRIAFRRAMKKVIQTAMEQGAEGIKIQCAGRLGLAELARTEHYKEGRTPLHTLKAFIDYGFAEANTTAGKIGVKVWICHKESMEEMQNAVNAKKSKAQKGAARQ
ncbi:MAG: 30S ribosomal protein S3 [Lentisphaeria bacterium]|nr:30S ribosomal protein S3 [Lentisphaeria bacterium]